MKPVFERELRASSEAPPRSREERRPVELTGYLIRSDKSIIDVKIVDLAFDGCGVRTLVPLARGEKVKLSVLGRGAANAMVRWYQSRKAGLVFLPDSVEQPRGPRKVERIPVHAEVALRRTGRGRFRVTAFDVTRFGCKCEFVDRPAIEERVFVKFEGLDSLEATVCWIEESRMGLMFMTPMHPAVFDMLLMRLAAGDEAHSDA